MLFKTIKVDGLNVFYREAGQESAPKLVLLHGFPASSHQYRNLIPALADRFHVIAPDYPGFGIFPEVAPSATEDSKANKLYRDFPDPQRQRGAERF
jgi:pimeloyl-ACP methyl ester carboxylesterase